MFYVAKKQQIINPRKGFSLLRAGFSLKVILVAVLGDFKNKKQQIDNFIFFYPKTVFQECHLYINEDAKCHQ